MTQYYELSTDYGLADKLMKEGASLGVWLTMEIGERSKPFVASQYCQELWLNDAFVTDIIDFVAYCELKQAKFILPVPDPTVELKADVAELKQQYSKLQSSLTQALDEADELRERNTKLQADLDTAKNEVTEYKKAQEFSEKASNGASFLTLGLKQRLENCEAQNTIANEALTAIAKQLGFESFVSEDVMSAIADLYVQIDGREAALEELTTECEKHREFASRFETYGVNGKPRIRFKFDPIGGRERIYVEEGELREIARDLEMANERQILELQAENEVYKKAIDAMSPNFANADKIIQRDRINADRAIQEQMAKNAKLEANLLVWEKFASDLHKELSNQIANLQENLTRSNSDRLSELTSIMRMVQALEDTPQDKVDGALRLIRQVIYNAICKLDPSQSFDA